MITKPFTTMFTALAVAGLLGACTGGGSGGNSGGSGDQAGSGQDGQELYDWVECMAGEGIELPEPTRNADGDLVIVGNGVNISHASAISLGKYSEEEFQAGTDVCGPPPAWSGLSEASLRDEEKKARAFSQCMRDNGVENFPDPDFSADISDGFFSPWPREALDGVEPDPDFETADEACRDIIAPAGSEGT